MQRNVLALIVSAAMLLTAGCGASESGSAQDFATLVGTGYGADYDPMGPPAEAIQAVDLIVRGTLVDVFEGLAIAYPDAALTARHKGAYATFEVQVAEVLSGDTSLVTNGSVYVQVGKSSEMSERRLAQANPRPSVLLMLVDISEWRPQPDATVALPARVPAEAPTLFANPDGFWLQTPEDAEMVAFHTEVGLLDSAWGAPRTLDDLAQIIERCKDGTC